jgi:hypothetical protein
MKATGIALKEPKDQRWSLMNGDELVYVDGISTSSSPSTTRWAISHPDPQEGKISDGKSGGRHILVTAQLKHQGCRSAVMAGNIDDLYSLVGPKVAVKFKELTELDIATTQCQLDSPGRDALEQECRTRCEQEAKTKAASATGPPVEDINDDTTKRMLQLKDPRDRSPLTSTEIAFTVRCWDRLAVFFKESTEYVYHIVHDPSATLVPPLPSGSLIQKQDPLHLLALPSRASSLSTPTTFDPLNVTWRYLTFLANEDVVVAAPGTFTKISIVPRPAIPAAADDGDDEKKKKDEEEERARQAQLAAIEAQAAVRAAEEKRKREAKVVDKGLATAAGGREVHEISTQHYGVFSGTLIERLSDHLERWTSYSDLSRAATLKKPGSAKKAAIAALDLVLHYDYEVAPATETIKGRGRSKKKTSINADAPSTSSCTSSGNVLQLIAILTRKAAKHSLLHLWMVPLHGTDSAAIVHVDIRRILRPITPAPATSTSTERLAQLKTIAASWCDNDRSTAIQSIMAPSPSGTKSGPTVLRNVRYHASQPLIVLFTAVLLVFLLSFTRIAV